MRKKQITIIDIARELRISHSTVSRALSQDRRVSELVLDETRTRVKKKAEEMGYSPNLAAQAFAKGRTGILGVLTYYIFLEMYGRQTNEILVAAEEKGYQVALGMATNWFPLTPSDDQIKRIKQMISRGIDGLFINTCGDVEESDRVMDAVQGQVPVVTYFYPVRGLSGILLDQISGFFEATSHLIRLGHERIGFVGPEWNEASPASAKAKGYLLAMQKYGLPHEFIHSRGMQTEGGYIQAKEFGNRFTALVCRCDYTAIGVCRGLLEAGIRVPEEVAVVGNGNMDVAAYVTPALTTLAIPYETIAQEVMGLMQEQLDGQDIPRQITLKSSLILRESCGAAMQKSIHKENGETKPLDLAPATVPTDSEIFP